MDGGATSLSRSLGKRHRHHGLHVCGFSERTRSVPIPTECLKTLVLMRLVVTARGRSATVISGENRTGACENMV